MKWSVLLSILLLSISSAIAQQAQSFKVRYISAENVYLAAGRSDSLSIGDKLAIKRNDSLIADLEIIYVAEHSVSCKILQSTGAILAGDKAVVTQRIIQPGIEATPQKAETQTTAPAKISVTQPAHKRSQPLAKISGSVSFQMSYWDDRSDANLDFKQPTARLNFRVTKIGGKALSFIVRSRARQDQRSKYYSTDIPKNQWRNRIYEMSLIYDDPQARLNFRAGRIISNKFSGIGYIDGLLLQTNLSAISNFGVFAGTQPQWQSSDFQTSIQKYGAFYNYTKGDYQSIRREHTVAFAGEYHSSTVSREFIYLQNSINNSDRWGGFGSAEIDINRGWRKTKTNQSLTLTNLYISGNYRLAGWVRANLSLDNRKNYWTYETRNIADTLFDNALRQGIRTNFDFHLLGGYYFNAGIGANKRKTDTGATHSYSAGLSKNNFMIKQVFFNTQIAGFTNPNSSGLNSSFRIGRNFLRADYLSIGYGNYYYKIKGGQSRVNQWLSLLDQIELAYGFYIFSQYEYNFGDDLKGYRILAEVGYRF
jgi:hypothetical protein